LRRVRFHVREAESSVAAMIRHVVMWSVRGDDAAARARNARVVRDAFAQLRGQVPGLLALDVGIDDSRVDYACDVVLIADFATRAALADYATHPAHLQVRARLGDLRSARHQVDYEVADADSGLSDGHTIKTAGNAPAG